MKYDWDSFINKLAKTSDFHIVLSELEDIVSQSLDFNTFQMILKEIRLKTHYMSDDKRILWSISRYLQILFSIDFEDYSKEISKKHLEDNLLKDKFDKEQAIKNDPIRSIKEKDLLLEHIEETYNRDVLLLNANYRKRYTDWLESHKDEVHEYVQLKIRIEEWVKSQYTLLGV